MKRIPLTQGKIALVDDADYEWLSQWKWSYIEMGYAVRRKTIDGKKCIFFMHREIMNCPREMVVDHKETGVTDYGLNNQRHNLRICTPAQNSRNQIRPRNNTSGYKGISWIARLSKWQAQIRVDGKLIYLGVFFSKIDAAQEYDLAARKYFGEYANTNF